MKPSLTVAIYGAGQVGRTVAGLLSSDAGYSVRGPFDRSHRAAALEELLLLWTANRNQAFRPFEETVRDEVEWFRSHRYL